MPAKLANIRELKARYSLLTVLAFDDGSDDGSDDDSYEDRDEDADRDDERDDDGDHEEYEGRDDDD